MDSKYGAWGRVRIRAALERAFPALLVGLAGCSGLARGSEEAGSGSEMVREQSSALIDSSGTWTALSQPVPGSVGNIMLLSDGTVLGAQSLGTQWYRLTPDAAGNYVNGTWSSIASMHDSRLYDASTLLGDGRLFVAGGEYGTGKSSVEIYQPRTNTWSYVSGFDADIGDSTAKTLPDGRILLLPRLESQGRVYSEANGAGHACWTTTGPKLSSDRNDEESAVILRDGTILSVNVWSQPGAAQKYQPSSNQWLSAGNVGTALNDAKFEIGPGVLLNDGRALFLGANGQTALYTAPVNPLDPGSWQLGPPVPEGKALDDAPAAVLPNGNVLFIADQGSPTDFLPPSGVFEYLPASNTFASMPLPPWDLAASPSYIDRLLMLPTGQALLTDGDHMAVYTPTGTADPALKPTITAISDHGNGTYTLTGSQLNGFSEGAYYGDDAQMSTNFPIVRLTDGVGAVRYGQTYDFGGGVAVGNGSASFRLPRVPAATYSLEVIANGVSSSATSIVVTAAAAACGNAVIDGNESDVDCGGACGPCVDEQTCRAGSDCQSGLCSGGKCATTTCSDNSKNADETDVDCGGCACAACGDRKQCVANRDCGSNRCVSGACQSSYVSVDTGDGFTCAVADDGKVRCWGKNDSGQLGVTAQGSLGDAPGEIANLQPVPLSGTATRVALGSAHACALLTNGAVQCWGDNRLGQLGVGDVAVHAGVVTPDLGGAVFALVAGDYFNCSIASANSAVKCWGSNDAGQLGIGSVQTIGDGPGEMGAALRPVSIPDLVIGIAAGGSHVCVVALDNNFAGGVRCWGDNDSGQLGSHVFGSFGDQAAELTPQVVSLGSGFNPTQVALGANHTCALSDFGKVKCWGSSMFGELGYGDTLDRGYANSTMGNSLPVVPLGFGVDEVVAGGGLTCVRSGGSARCWGMGSYALGQPALIAWDSIGDRPGEIAGLPPIAFGTGVLPNHVATSGSHTCAVLVDGQVKCWGLNFNGELGLGDTAIRGDEVSDMGDNLPFLALP